jgi:hypothetical protein
MMQLLLRVLAAVREGKMNESRKFFLPGKQKIFIQ